MSLILAPSEVDSTTSSSWDWMAFAMTDSGMPNSFQISATVKLVLPVLNFSFTPSNLPAVVGVPSKGIRAF